uniref:Uncharacterized protein n=3 Tax=gambiae species complex TaxID=44542 RepID=A0A6E8W313_ANOCL
MGKVEQKPRKGCFAQCMEPILCSCYGCMARLLTNVFLCVLTCFLVYVGFLHFLRGKDAGEAFKNAFRDFVGLFWSSS